MKTEIELQDALRGMIVARLLKAGVRRIDFSAEDFFPDLMQEVSELSEFDSLFLDMWLWLRDEGFVRFETMCSGSNGEACVINVQATSKTIALLDMVLPGESGVTPRRLIEPDGQANGTANHVKLGAFVGAVLGGFTSAIGS